MTDTSPHDRQRGAAGVENNDQCVWEVCFPSGALAALETADTKGVQDFLLFLFGGGGGGGVLFMRVSG